MTATGEAEVAARPKRSRTTKAKSPTKAPAKRRAPASGTNAKAKVAAKAHTAAPKATPATPTTTTWVAQFVYPDAEGNAQVSLLTVTAETREAAQAIAVRHAPTAEFMVSLHPRSDEQFLGQVRMQALNATAPQR